METIVKRVWEESTKHISNTIENVKVKQEKYSEDIKSLESKIDNFGSAYETKLTLKVE